MHELVIASNNQGKIQEIKTMIGSMSLLSLNDIGFNDEIAEPFETFEENALAKASAVYQFCNKNVMADDSGLCVKALNERPGVHSAYFGGLPRSDEKNNNQLLAALSEEQDRSAFYKAVICLIWDGQTYFFEDICEGFIAESPQGSNGFGYDPLFIPKGYSETFGVLPVNLKNELSHRGKAIKKMIDFLKEHIS